MRLMGGFRRASILACTSTHQSRIVCLTPPSNHTGRSTAGLPVSSKRRCVCQGLSGACLFPAILRRLFWHVVGLPSLASAKEHACMALACPTDTERVTNVRVFSAEYAHQLPVYNVRLGAWWPFKDADVIGQIVQGVIHEESATCNGQEENGGWFSALRN